MTCFYYKETILFFENLLIFVFRQANLWTLGKFAIGKVTK